MEIYASTLFPISLSGSFPVFMGCGSRSSPLGGTASGPPLVHPEGSLDHNRRLNIDVLILLLSCLGALGSKSMTEMRSLWSEYNYENEEHTAYTF